MTNLTAPEQELQHWLGGLPELPGVRPVDRLPSSTFTAARRANFRRRLDPDLPTIALPQQRIISLVRDDGVLRWRFGVTGVGIPSRRAGFRGALPPGQVVKQYAFEKLETSDVYTTLVTLDRQLTPQAAYAANAVTGLRRWRGGAFEPFPNPTSAAGKKVLLFIHGTFSNSEALLTQGFATFAAGNKVLADAEKQYDFILTYDHPTLSVSPSLNAFDLAALLRPAPAALDIICHSRGGLVTRWFCEAFGDLKTKRRAVMVASPMAGTSFAAAPKLRSTLDMLTNVADVLRTGADLFSATPLFLAASGLLRVVGAVTNFAASTPLLDAAIALIPGLDAQSRTGNNEEIRRLRANTGNSDFSSGQIRYFAVVSNFQPTHVKWNFLQYFSKPMQRLANFGADLVFQSDNDLVVDTASMSEVADAQVVSIAHDFGTTDSVHHTTYFRQPQTVTAIRKSFGF